MASDPKQLYAVIREVRACFQALAAFSDSMLSEWELNAWMRAVLEVVADDPTRTVPDIARLKKVSRQHIQVNVNALMEKGLVAAADNPAHKRSPLVLPTERGLDVFAAIRKREAPLLEDFVSELSERSMRTTSQTLRKLRALCEAHLEGENDED